MKNILIIGCGLIGSSLVRSIYSKKLSKKIFVYEKIKKNILIIKKLKLPCVLVDDLQKVIPKIDLIIFCTPMSQYEKIILKINKSLKKEMIITDVGSTKEASLKMIKNAGYKVQVVQYLSVSRFVCDRCCCRRSRFTFTFVQVVPSSPGWRRSG